VPTATVKIATQWVQISQLRPLVRVWIAHTGILPFVWRASNRYSRGCGCL
jgi:hypothetical protein